MVKFLLHLDGSERELNDSMLIIADTERPVGVAGIMGGFDSEVTNETTTVLFEAAVFNGPSIRRTSKALVCVLKHLVVLNVV